jgi:two-component system sensor histidine kinase DegS
MWQLIEERVRSKEAIERHLMEYQSLYRLYVKEVSLAVLEERAQIAWDIHDGLVQTLVGLTYKMDLCQELIDSNPSLCRERLSENRRHLKEAIQEARQVIFNLKPLSFEHMELFPALKNYLRSYEHQYKIETSLHTRGSEKGLLPKSKIVIFRIIQEALSNIQKHSKAKRVEIKLRIDRRTLRVTIIDDGIGFDPRRVAADPEKWASFGLKGIMERAKLLGGTSQVESAVGEGTRVLVQIPLEDKEDEAL